MSIPFSQQSPHDKKNMLMPTWTILLACSIAYNFYLIKTPINVYDEGLILTGADRIIRGQQVPYADFWSMYPPGQYYLLAFLFKIFGSSILTERIYDLIIRSLLSSFIFIILKKFNISNIIAYTGWGTALIWLGSFQFVAYPIYIYI